MAVKHGAGFNLDGAAAGNSHLKTALRTLEEGLRQVQKKTGAQSIDTGRRAPVGPVAARSEIKIVSLPGSGQLSLQITNPEFAQPRSGSNLVRAPLYHKVEYSSHADFSSNVTALPPSQQTVHLLPAPPNASLYVRVSSSHDGVVWNDPVVHGPITYGSGTTAAIANASGPLPITGSFTTKGGTILLMASGSGFSSLNGAIMGMFVDVDNVQQANPVVYANVFNTHLPFVPVFLVIPGLAAGAHTVRLRISVGNTDSNDRFNVTVMELPY